MNLLSHPDLVDRLASAYALGTLRGGARRRFETLARSSPSLRVAVLLWQERFVSLTELQQSEAPDPNVWKRIENLVAAEPTRAAPASRAPAPPARSWWRALTAGAAVAALAAVAVAWQLQGELRTQRAQLAGLQQQGQQLALQNARLQGDLRARPDVRYVSVLADERARPAMLVTFDPAHATLTVKRVGDYQEGADHSLQLWGLPASGAPRSLGVLQAGAVQQLPMPQEATDMPKLAISLEPPGGVPGDRGPTGPVLWQGAVLQAPV